MASVRAARRAVVLEAPAPLNALICGTLPAVLATFVAAVVLLQQNAAAAPLLPRREGEGSPTAAPGAPAGSSLASSAATAAGSCAAGSFWPTGSRAARTGALNGLCAAAAASWAFAEGVRVRPAEDISAARVGTERQSGKSIGLRPIHLQGVHRAAALLTWPPSPIHLTK